MIEAYAFLAAFMLQIVVMSVLQPFWITRLVRKHLRDLSLDRLAEIHPDVDFRLRAERQLSRYRAMNLAIALLGLVPLTWVYFYAQRPDWTDGPVEALAALYFGLQALPLGLFAWVAGRYRRWLTPLLGAKRTAALQRRQLFDFVSPFAVSLAVLSYLLFVGYVFYIARDPFPGFNGLITLGAITLVYVLNAFCVYRLLYGRKPDPFAPHGDRMRAIGLGVKACVYSCTIIVGFLSINFTLVLWDLQRWEPAAQSVLFVTTVVLSFVAYISPPSWADRLRERQL